VEAAEHYAEIRLYLEKKGTPIGERDLMIAAIGRSRKLTLVTNNRREFDRVPDLEVTGWAT
jgi:tRNA(fMet)-specific endonuclease VapC